MRWIRCDVGVLFDLYEEDKEDKGVLEWLQRKVWCGLMCFR